MASNFYSPKNEAMSRTITKTFSVSLRFVVINMYAESANFPYGWNKNSMKPAIRSSQTRIGENEQTDWKCNLRQSEMGE